MKIYQPLQQLLEAEEIRQTETACFIASENFASEAIMQLSGSIFTNKYAEGYPGARYYNGCKHMDEIEQLAIDLVTELFGANYANVQPHSGANANLAVMNALLKPDDRILGMDLASGGHLSHGADVNISGKWFDSHMYGVEENGLINYHKVRMLAKQHKPKMIIAGASAYPRQIDWESFRKIADEVGAILLVDMAHYSGLIAGGVYDNPIEYADVVTSTTHKTLRGPRGGVILWNDIKFSKKINSSVFPGTQGGPLMNQIAAKAQCFAEASQPEFRIYAQDVVNNAKTMAEIFMQEGIDLVTSGTDSHILLLDLQSQGVSGKEIANVLESECKIIVNKNGVPNDPKSFRETSGIRIGTAAETTKNRPKEWFEEMARKIAYTIKQWA